MILDREKLAELARPVPALLEVPELGGSVYVKRAGWKLATSLKGEAAEQGVTLVIACVCDEHGTPVFTEDDRATIEAWDGQVVGALVAAIMGHYGITEDAARAAAKN
jgi:hypothetical protein